MEKQNPKTSKDKSKKKQSSSDIGKYSGLAFQMVAVIILGFLISSFVKSKMHEGMAADLVQAGIILFFVIASIYLVLKDFISPKKK